MVIDLETADVTGTHAKGEQTALVFDELFQPKKVNEDDGGSSLKARPEQFSSFHRQEDGLHFLTKRTCHGQHASRQ